MAGEHGIPRAGQAVGGRHGVDGHYGTVRGVQDGQDADQPHALRHRTDTQSRGGVLGGQGEGVLRRIFDPITEVLNKHPYYIQKWCGRRGTI